MPITCKTTGTNNNQLQQTHQVYDKPVQEFSSRHKWTSLELQSEATLYIVCKADTVKA